MKILLSGFHCNPYRGSEGGRTWNWAWHLSKSHQVWVLTQPIARPRIEEFLAEHPNDNLKFLWVETPNTLTPWVKRDSFKLVRLRYGSWLRQAYKVAAAAHRKYEFDVAHHVSLNAFFPPPQLYRLPIPFVWGPIGGAMTTPRAFLSYYGRDRWIESMRTLRVRLSNRWPGLRKAVRATSLLLAINRETADALLAAGASDVRLFLDAGPRTDFFVPEPRPIEDKKELVIMWAGLLFPRKALGLAIEALARVRHLPVRLRVVGEGWMRQPWRELAESLGVGDRIEFIGQVPWLEMPQQYRQCDAFIFTSLRDSSGNVVFEAMASSLPIITLDHQGVGAFVPSEAGIKVPVTTPEETVRGLAEGIENLAGDPELRARLGAAGWSCIGAQSWDHRAEVMTGFYEEVIGHRSSSARVALPPTGALELADE
ncbi:MAG: glycosyltransferase family 4 protein [Kiloniellales bacterium]